MWAEGVTRRLLACSLLLGLMAAATAEAQGVETYLNVRAAVGRMVPGAAQYNYARFSATSEEIASARARWSYDLEPGGQYLLFFGWNEGGSLRGVMYVGSHLGKHGPIKMAVAMDSSGTVRDLAVMEYQEVRGRPVRERAYLEQYVGKTPEDPIALGQDIDGLTGASYSSRAVTRAVKEAVVVFSIYVGDRNAAAPPEE